MICLLTLRQNGPYDSYQLGHDARGEPFPVKVTVRSQKYADLITRLAKEG